MSTVECRSCIPLDCDPPGLFDYYNLDGPLFRFVNQCPSGFDCNTSDSITMICCGDTLTADLSGMPLQQRADTIEALQQQCQQKLLFCNIGGRPPQSPSDPPDRFCYNSAQRSTVNCPDGSPFTYIVPAGSVLAKTCSEANNQALNIAKKGAAQHRLCITSTIPTEFCANSTFSFTVTVSGKSVSGSSNSWMVSGGKLPTGLSLNGRGSVLTISGTPTIAGSYYFVIGVLTPNGDYAFKAFTLCIVDIAPASSTLTAGTVGAAYTNTFTATSCATAPLSWQVSSGTLPTGLTLNETTGVISGTPTVDGTYIFTIKLQDSAT